MKYCFVTFFGLIVTQYAYSQWDAKKYHEIWDKGDSLYEAKDYKNSALAYSSALVISAENVSVWESWITARSWSLANYYDSAFYTLNLITPKNVTYSNLSNILQDKDLSRLHNDKRWQHFKEDVFLKAYQNLLLIQKDAGVEFINFAKSDTALAFALGNNADSAISQINLVAYQLLYKKRFNEAYKHFKLSVDYFPPNYILYLNMMDYYKAIGDMDRVYVYFSRAQVIKYGDSSFISDTSLKVDSLLRADYRALSKLLRVNVYPPEYLSRMIANAYLKAGMTKQAYNLFKMNIDFYPTSYTANKDLGVFLNKTGSEGEGDAYNQKSLILQYNLPKNFFHPSFNIENYIVARTDSLAGRKGIKPMPPEFFIEEVANQFLLQREFDKAKMLFKMNVDNYPTSYYAHKSMSSFYKKVNDKSNQQQFELQAEAAKEKYGTRRSRILKNGPVADTTFDVSVSKPVCNSNCPNILIDYVHNITAITSLENDFKSLSQLFSNDGFKVVKNYGPLTLQSLAHTKILVLRGGEFEKNEIQILNTWVRQGGSLLTFTHHDWLKFDEVLQSFGIQTKEIEITDDSLHGLLRDRFIVIPSYIYFSESDSLLGKHIILAGRNASEKITRVQTLASKTIIGPSGSSVLLRLSKSAVDFMSIDTQDRTSRVPVRTKGTRSLGLAFSYGNGKVVVTDSWALKALLFENSERGKLGMNTPGNDNKQFALNIIRWLAGNLK